MKKDTKVLLVMLAVSLFMFGVLPILVNLVPNDEFAIMATRVVYLVVDVIYMAVIGWMARNFAKKGYLVPLASLAVALVAQVLVLGGVLPVILLFYAESSYMVYCFRGLVGDRRKKKAGANAQKPFPKIVKKR